MARASAAHQCGPRSSGSNSTSSCVATTTVATRWPGSLLETYTRSAMSSACSTLLCSFGRRRTSPTTRAPASRSASKEWRWPHPKETSSFGQRATRSFTSFFKSPRVTPFSPTSHRSSGAGSTGSGCPEPAVWNDLAKCADEHSAIAKSIAASDHDGIRRLVNEHIDHMEASMLRHLEMARPFISTSGSALDHV